VHVLVPVVSLTLEAAVQGVTVMAALMPDLGLPILVMEEQEQAALPEAANFWEEAVVLGFTDKAQVERHKQSIISQGTEVAAAAVTLPRQTGKHMGVAVRGRILLRMAPPPTGQYA